MVKVRRSPGRDTGLMNSVCGSGDHGKWWARILRLTQNHIEVSISCWWQWEAERCSKEAIAIIDFFLKAAAN